MKKVRQVHFVGIGGIGMSGIAEVLLNLGYGVSGSDLAASSVTRRLEDLGGKVAIGHEAGNVKGADVVVTSSAVRPGNVEVAEARRLQIPVIPRAEMLAELMRMKYGVAIAGAHGKTSTTSMVAQVLSGSNLDPTIVIGGRLEILGSNAKLGKGDLLVAEADESDGSFLHLSPTIAVVTNLDAEHLDHYGTFAKLQDAFVDFLNKVPFYGVGIVCLDDPAIREILPRLERKIVTYGLEGRPDLRAEGMAMKEFSCRFEVSWKEKPLGSVELRVPGLHNVSNSLAAIAVGLELDLPFDWIASHLSQFRGADRRFQLKGEANGILVIDDYGHHPSEIRATLRAARRGWSRRTVVVFQPHRFSRAAALHDEFARSFEDADVLVVTDIYPAGEKPLPGVSGESLAEAIRRQGHRDVTLVCDLKEVPDFLLSRVRPEDMVITMGAGSVWRAGEEFLKRLGKSS
ncbi:MAG TPA: UDP-N-acetylmuramate--L-alanine ligase [Candidatus Polarisedimenticolia bacterium]|jgi:UDP-N-acetylmuramate--alanine ligase|nr:UDP-N-acetylmuramate--L-alanine ligase [Candidatus Polarisedimenticolia bacterium]